MNRIFITFIVLTVVAMSAHGQVGGIPVTPFEIDLRFDAGLNPFKGAGFAPVAGVGQIDSDNFRVTGLSDGNGTFGGTHTSGDFARGESTGSTTSTALAGGIYAFAVNATELGLGWKPSDADLTPGAITAKLLNATGKIATTIKIEYDLWTRNISDKSNTITFAMSPDDGTYITLGSPVTTAATKDVTPAWVKQTKVLEITELSLPIINGCMYIQWQITDAGGSDTSHDEFAITRLRLQAADPTPTACGLMLGVRKANLPIIDPIDRLFVRDVVLSWSVLIRTMPILHIPNDKSLNGLDAYFQVFMINSVVFPKDPIKMSNGLHVKIGGTCTQYGNHSGLLLWAPMEARIGKPFQAAFKFVQ